MRQSVLRRSSQWLVLPLLLAACGQAPSGQGEAPPVPQPADQATEPAADGAATEADAAEELDEQKRMDLYYSADAIISLILTMDSTTWNDLRNQQPNGGTCNNSFIGDRYSWFEATNLDIQVSDLRGRHFGEYSYPSIGVKKKSFCGSINSTKPSINVDLARFDGANGDKAESEIGTSRLTWNNSLQDDTVLKQCVGYHLFRLAGLPASRCNFSSLTVVMPDTGETEWVGIYVNVEPMKKKYFKNPANDFEAGAKGTLYEISTQDIDLSGMTYTDYKGFADDFARQDYGLSALAMDQDDQQSKAQQRQVISGLNSTINTDQFIQYWAMEAITQSRDGYTRNITNSYIYNDEDLSDADALSSENTNFSFLPWGIDKIMTNQDCWQLFCCSRVPTELYADPSSLASVNQAVVDILADFGTKQTEIDGYIDLLATSANKTWTGEDALFGANDGTIDYSATYLKEWLAAAIDNAVASINGGKNYSCQPTCFNGPGDPCNK